MKKIIFLVCSIAIVLHFGSCTSESKVKEYPTIELLLSGEDSVVKNIEIMNAGTLIADTTKAGNKYSQIDSIVQYGLGLKYFVPDSLVGKELQVTVKLKALETEAISSGIVVSFHDPANKATFYNNFDLRGAIRQPNQWTDVNGEFMISAVANDFNGAYLAVYGYKPTGKGKLKIDNLSVSIKPIGDIDDEE